MWHLAFSHNGRFLASGCKDGTACIWEVLYSPGGSSRKGGTRNGGGGGAAVSAGSKTVWSSTGSEGSGSGQALTGESCHNFDSDCIHKDAHKFL